MIDDTMFGFLYNLSGIIIILLGTVFSGYHHLTSPNPGSLVVGWWGSGCLCFYQGWYFLKFSCYNITAEYSRLLMLVVSSQIVFLGSNIYYERSLNYSEVILVILVMLFQLRTFFHHLHRPGPCYAILNNMMGLDRVIDVIFNYTPEIQTASVVSSPVVPIEVVAETD